MKKIVILIGGCRYNRGSEAMVRGIVKTLRASGRERQIILSSKDDTTGNSLDISGVDRYVRRFTYNRNNKLLRYPIGVLRYILHLKELTNHINHSTLLKECEDSDLVIVVGGDNYDKAYGAFNDMHSFNKTLRKVSKGKIALLNCSLNPDEIDDKIIEDMTLFDKVTIRESISREALQDRLPDNLWEYYPDIAFNMDPKETELPKCFSLGDVIGINLSPLILGDFYTNNKELILQEYKDIIDYAVNTLKKQILLIPHVMNNSDLVVLKELYGFFKDNESVHILDNENLSAPEIKYIISNCWAYMGARTHSTIAAYSSCVPTMVLGYSVKSRGIAKDLFDDESKFVVPIQKITDKGSLKKIFADFTDNREDLKVYLDNTIPGYLEKASQYSEFFDRILGDE